MTAPQADAPPPAAPPRSRPLAWLSGWFAAGLAFALPFAITIAIIWMVVSVIDNAVAPWVKPALPPSMASLAESLPGAGALIAAAALIAIGALAATLIGGCIVKQTEPVFNTAPLARGVCGSPKQIVETLSNPGGQSFKKAILIGFPTPGQWSVVFITNDQPA